MFLIACQNHRRPAMSNTFFHIIHNLFIADFIILNQHIGIIDMHLLAAWICHSCKRGINQIFHPLLLRPVFRCVAIPDIPQQHIAYFFQSITAHRRCCHPIDIFCFYFLKYFYDSRSCCMVAFIHQA